MAEFDIDQLKISWQQRELPKTYQVPEIESMLGRSSRNYVKYIFQISLAEFLVFLCLNFYYFFSGGDVSDMLNIINKLGAIPNTGDEKTLGAIYLTLKILSIGMTVVFVILFYVKYKKINIESDVKNFILQIISFKKTVKNFIIANILLLIGSTSALVLYILTVLRAQNIGLNNPKIIGFAMGTAFALLFGCAMIWLYYWLVYGIIMKKLTGNLEQLQNNESDTI